MSTLLNQGFTEIPDVKVMLNIGALLDIPTGTYLKGKHRENLLLGGLGSLTGVVGIGNSFKSTIMHYMMLSAADKLLSTSITSMSTYDTEVNVHKSRLRSFTQNFDSFKGKDILEDGTWVVTDKVQHRGDEWYELLKKFTDNKVEKGNVKSLTFDTPFLSRDKESYLKVIIPTFSEVDSFSAFDTADVVKMQDENKLGESGGNMIHARQGLAKTRLLMELPHMSSKCNHFILMSAHLGKEVQLASGPYAPQPTKKLQHMKAGDKIKGCSDQWFFLLSNCWQTTSVTPLVNQTTKGPEYPSDSNDNTSGDMDLNLVTIKQLRSKSGPSGYSVELVVSQREGVLPSLTEFHYIKDMDRFGISGTLQHYTLDLYPDCKLSRTTVRSKIDNDNKLRRALNITSELCQMREHYRGLEEELCTPAQLYEYLIKEKFDMDLILGRTRGWWTINNDNHPSLYYLSTMDLVDMRNGKYWPYWMNDDKTIKKEYLK